MRPVIYTYESNGTSKKIAEALNCERHYYGSGYEYRDGDLVINWGSGHLRRWMEGKPVLNRPEHVAKSVNKQVTFEYLSAKGVRIPERTTIKEIAADWINQGEIVFCRTVLDGMDGAGIVLARANSELVHAPLYTRYVNNEDEYRVHVWGGEAIFWTQKKLESYAPRDTEPYVKSGQNWLMAWADDIPEDAKTQAINAIKALKLDFGAVDIGYNRRENKAYVFETNTAPGGFGRVTLQRYTDAIRRACAIQ